MQEALTRRSPEKLSPFTLGIKNFLETFFQKVSGSLSSGEFRRNLNAKFSSGHDAGRWHHYHR